MYIHLTTDYFSSPATSWAPPWQVEASSARMRSIRGTGGGCFDPSYPANFTKNVDFAAWAKRAPNGSKALAAGTWTANLSWDSTRESWAWAGTLHATTTFVVR